MGGKFENGVKATLLNITRYDHIRTTSSRENDSAKPISRLLLFWLWHQTIEVPQCVEISNLSNSRDIFSRVYFTLSTLLLHLSL